MPWSSIIGFSGLIEIGGRRGSGADTAITTATTIPMVITTTTRGMAHLQGLSEGIFPILRWIDQRDHHLSNLLFRMGE
jgi:hypothetical protein